MLSGEVRDHFVGQAKACRGLGSPFTARLCLLFADRLDDTSRFGRRIATWPPKTCQADAVALRAAAAFHALVRAGQTPALAQVYPPHEADDAALWAAVESTIASSDDFLFAWLDSPPQTNEVNRSGILLGGALIVAAETGLPLVWHEIGASMGLNLGFDRYAYSLRQGAWGAATSPVRIACEWRGKAPPLDAPLRVLSRAGCDLNPLDARNEADVERLMSYIWADQAERLKRIAAAIDATAAAGIAVEKVGAADWLARRLADFPQSGRAFVVAHTIMWQYMPQAEQARAAKIIAEAGARASADAPLAWLRLEADGESGSAAITLTSWPGGREQMIGRASFHGYWAEWFSRDRAFAG